MSKEILIIAEQHDGVFRKVTFEAIAEARRLMAADGGAVSVLVMGSGIADTAGETARYGADTILVADDPGLADYNTLPYADVAAAVIAARKPAAVLTGATACGRDLAARLAARIDSAVAMDCIALGMEDGTLVATRPMYGGKALAEVVLSGNAPIAAVRPNAMRAEAAAGAGKVETVTVSLGPAVTTILEKQMETSRVELTEADAVVSGGRGMGGADYSAIEALAQALGGAVGASRSAVDEGWRPHSDQVGQTGKVVSPNLYIACGISGAIQHLAGMSSSRVIVAINKDPEAPIFARADYGIADDLFAVVPEITAEVKKLKG